MSAFTREVEHEQIFLGDVTKFRLDVEDLKVTPNLNRSIAYHSEWWLKNQETEKGRQFLQQPDVVEYRKEIKEAIQERHRERIRQCIRENPHMFKF